MSNSAVLYLVKCASTKFASRASNAPSRNGRSIAIAVATGSEPLADRATRSIPGASSIPTTFAPVPAAANAATPVPVPTSSTRHPASIPVSSTRSRAGSARRGAWIRAYVSATLS